MANELEKTLLGTSKRSVNNTIDKNSTYIEQKKLHKVFVQEEDPGEVEDGCIWLTYTKKKIVKSFPIQVDFSLELGDGSPSVNGNLILVTIPDKENIENPIFVTGSDTYCLDILALDSLVMELAGFNSTDNREVFSVFGIKKYVDGEIVDITSQDTDGLLWINLYAINNEEELTISKWSYKPHSFAGERGYLYYMNTPNTLTTISNKLPVYLDISFTN